MIALGIHDDGRGRALIERLSRRSGELLPVRRSGGTGGGSDRLDRRQALEGSAQPGPQRVEVQLGRALPVRPRLNQYRSNRREAMQVFMQDLEQAFVALMPDASRA